MTLERAVLGLGPDAAVAAVQQGLTTPGRLRAELRALGRVRGTVALAAALDDLDGGSRSWLERRFRRLLRDAGLPPPVGNHPVELGTRRVWLDACYPVERVAIELDGRAYHLDARDWEADLERQNDVVLEGWLLLRFPARAIRDDPESVAAAVRRALEERGVAECRDRSPVHAPRGDPALPTERETREARHPPELHRGDRHLLVR